MYESIATNFEAVADAIPRMVAISQGDQTRTWQEFELRASRLAGHLVAAGVNPGDRVSVNLFRSLEYLEAVFAITKIRAVFANVNYDYREQELRYLFDDCGARAVIFDAELADRVVAAAEGRDLILIENAPGGGPSSAGTASFQEIAATAAPAPRQERSGDDTFITYTGGTTGMPKAVLLRQGDLMQGYATLFAAEGLRTPETLADLGTLASRLAHAQPRRVALPASPLMHSHGLHGAMSRLVLGGAVVLRTARSFDPNEIWELVQDHRVTDLAIVGDAFAKPLVDALDQAEAAGTPFDLSSLLSVFSGGAILSAPNKAGILRRAVNAVIIDVLASSEGGPFGLAETRYGDDVATSRFKLAPNARLLDENDQDVEPGSGVVGLLAAPMPAPLGYFGDAEKSAQTFRLIDGVHYAIPGDRALLERDGSMTLLGRDSSVINTGGEKVFAEEVELVVRTHPAIADVVVTGVPDERWGTRVVALVALHPDMSATTKDIQALVAENLARYKKPREVLFVPEIKRSPAGKMDRQWAKDAAVKATTQLSA